MYKFRLTVADGKGLKGNDDVVLTVKEGMRPTLNASTCTFRKRMFFFSMKISNLLLS